MHSYWPFSNLKCFSRWQYIQCGWEIHLYSSSYASLVICICAPKFDSVYNTPKTNSVQACVNANTSSISYAVPKCNAKCNSWCNANAHSQCYHKGCYYRLSSSLIITTSFATFDFSRPVNDNLVFLNFSRYFMTLGSQSSHKRMHKLTNVTWVIKKHGFSVSMW